MRSTPNPAPVPTWSRLWVSALLMGGHVSVAKGRDIGGSFQHLPICRSDQRSECVVTYASFDAEPPPDSFFGRASDPFGPSGDPNKLKIACSNPAALSGGSGDLQPYFTSSGPTPWVRYPGLYRAHCMHEDGADWLQVDAAEIPGDPRPGLTPSAFLGPGWGLHIHDVNLALGNLVKLVKTQGKAYLRGR